MLNAAEALEFERAAELRDKIQEIRTRYNIDSNRTQMNADKHDKTNIHTHIKISPKR